MLALSLSLVLSASLTAPLAASPPPAGAAEGPRYAEVFEELRDLVRAEFYDAETARAWGELTPDERAALARLDGPAEWGDWARTQLGKLGASHTTLYTPADREYYELLDVFFHDAPPEALEHLFPDGRIVYPGAGLIARDHGARTFVEVVYPGGPAERAGLVRGDELRSAGGEPWADVAPFAGRVGEVVEVEYRREVGGEVRTARVAPEFIQPREAFLRGIREGARLVERPDGSVLYVPVLSYAGPWYHEAVKETLRRPEFAGADALALDLRHGWGGASAEYLGLFNPVVPVFQMRRRGAAEWTEFSPAWTKPVAVLVGPETRSGKEMLAFAFRKHGLGPVIGRRTAGAVLPGSPRLLSDGSLAYLAVGDAMVDGVRLEGVGVAADVEVEDPLPHAGGADRTLEGAVDVLLDRAGGGG